MAKYKLNNIIRYDDGTWQRREENRLNNGIYKRLPWRLKEIPGHYAHLSKAPGLIAYTKDEKHGERDIQTQIKPGRYLTKFYPNMDDNRIRRLSGQIDALRFGLKFTTTPEEAVFVYRRGPHSCMKSRKAVCVYGTGDLSVAYLVEDQKIVARAVVWPKKKVYFRSYGHIEAIDARLRELGYKKSEKFFCFDGAKIGRIPIKKSEPDRIHMPSIDGHGQYDVIEGDEKHVVLTQNGAQNGNVLRLPIPCEKCGKMAVLRKTMVELGKIKWCTACVLNGEKEGAVVRCAYGSYAMKEDTIQVAFRVGVQDGSYYANLRTVTKYYPCGKDWVRQPGNAFYCHGSKQWYHMGDFRRVLTANNDYWEESFYNRAFA